MDRLATAGPEQATHFMTAEEVADLLGVSRKHIYNLCQSKRIPHTKVGALTRFNVDEILEWAKNGGCK